MNLIFRKDTRGCHQFMFSHRNLQQQQQEKNAHTHTTNEKKEQCT